MRRVSVDLQDRLVQVGYQDQRDRLVQVGYQDLRDLPARLDSAVLRVLREQVVCRDLQGPQEQVDSVDLRDLQEQVVCLDQQDPQEFGEQRVRSREATSRLFSTSRVHPRPYQTSSTITRAVHSLLTLLLSHLDRRIQRALSYLQKAPQTEVEHSRNS